MLIVSIVLLGQFIAAEVPVFRSDQSAEDPSLHALSTPAPAIIDTDGDEVPDLVENYVTGTDPGSWDTRGDGIPDGWLWKYGFDALDPEIGSTWATYPGAGEAPETYGPEGLWPRYRLTLREAYMHDRPEGWNESRDGPNPNALDPTTWMTSSGLPASWLLYYGLPLDQDPDAVVNVTGGNADRRLSVRDAYDLNTDPRSVDSDGDGLWDVDEIDVFQTDPSRFSTSGSGSPDGWLVHFGLDVHDPGVAFEDPDNDGLTNLQEFLYSELRLGRRAATHGEGLSPSALSSSGSGLPDGWLVRMGLDALDPDVAEIVVARSSAFSELRPGGEAPPDDLRLPQVNMTVRNAYEYGRPHWWDEVDDGVWWGGLSGSDPDTDGDGLPDVIEIRGWFVSRRDPALSNATSWHRVDGDPRSPDTDEDGLTDLEEFGGRVAGEAELTFDPTDPRKPDSDFDGLADLFEATHRFMGLGLAAMNPDSDLDGLADGVEFRYWTRSADGCRAGALRYDFTGSVYGSYVDWVPTLPWVVESGGALGAGPELCAVIDPGGDADADGRPNVLDTDSDGDGLLDGWEADPALYRHSPHASTIPRPETDPANPDTDGDGLPDGWEVEYGLYDPGIGDWNLSPAKWSSGGTDVGDGENDLDDDGITWYSFDRGSVGLARRSNEFQMTNFEEFRHGTDPNQADTSGDGLSDGWKAFWGSVYPGLSSTALGVVYPGSPGEFVLPSDVPLPDPLAFDDVVTSTFRYQRISDDPTPSARFDEDPGGAVSFTDASGKAVTVHTFHGTVEFSFLTHAIHRTNPFLSDADGDGMPDAWELMVSEFAPADERLEPVQWDAAGDEDDDGVSNLREYHEGTDPFHADTDRGGVTDAVELSIGLDPLRGADDRSMLDSNVDTDDDGIPDASEHFTTHTNASLADTDGDGLVDGPDVILDPERPRDAALIDEWRALGVRVVDSGDVMIARGEEAAGTDPLRWDSRGDQVSDGWRDAHPAAPATMYTYCRPPEWDEQTMGTWWWGLDPADPTHRPDAAPRDLDLDGLDDVNGEDAIPCANPDPFPVSGVPWDPGLVPFERRVRGQSYGFDLNDRAVLGSRDAGVQNGIPDVHDRARTMIVIEAIDGRPIDADGGVTLSKGQASRVTGQVLVDEHAGGNLLNPAGTGVPNVAVAVAINGPANVFGAGFTDADGRFDVRFNITRHHMVRIPEPGMVFMSHRDGEVTWEADPGLVRASASGGDHRNTLWVQSYNTSASVPPGHPTFYEFQARLPDEHGKMQTTTTHAAAAARSAPVPANVLSGPVIAFQAPEIARNGQAIRVRLFLTDDAGSPLGNRPVFVGWDGDASREVTTAANGSATFEIAASFPTPGPHRLTASFRGDPNGEIGPGEFQHLVLVKNRARIRASVDPAVPVVGEAILVHGTLDDGGNAVPNATVSIQGVASGTARTEPDGTFALRTTVPVEQDPGVRSLLVEFPGTGTHLPASAQLNVSVRDRAFFKDLDGAMVLRGNTTLVRGGLVDAAGRPLADHPVVVVVPGMAHRAATTDERGVFRVELAVPKSFVPGSHPFDVAFPGSSDYFAAEDRGHFIVRSATQLQVTPADAIRGRPMTLTGRLLDDQAAGVVGQGLGLVRSGSLVARGVTGEDGAFTLNWAVPPGTPLGPMDLRVVFNGSADGAYLATSNGVRIVVKEGVRLDLGPQPLRRGHNAWSGSITTDDGTPLPNAPVSLWLDGRQVGSATALANGRYDLEFDVPRDAPVGPHRVHVLYGGTATFAASRLEHHPVLVGRAAMTIDLPDRAVLDRPLIVRGHLEDELGTRIDGGVVLVEFGTVAANAPVQDGAFEASLHVPASFPTGPTTLSLEYRDHPFYDAEPMTAKLSAVEAVTLVVDVPRSGEAGQVAAASATLTSASGEPLAGVPLYVSAPGMSPPHFVLTDEAGRAVLPVRAGTAGDFPLNLTYLGTHELAPAYFDTSTHATYADGPGIGSTLWLATAFIVLAAAAGLAFLLRRWRRNVEAVGSVLDEALDSLLRGSDHRASIIAAYGRLEDFLAVVDVGPSPSRTARETIDEMRRLVPISTAPAEALVDVFELALYDSAEVGPAERDNAVNALRSVRDDVRTLVAERSSTGGVPV